MTDNKSLIVPSTRNQAQAVPIPDENYTDLMQAIIDREGQQITPPLIIDLKRTLTKILHRSHPQSTVAVERSPGDTEEDLRKLIVTFRDSNTKREFAILPFSEFDALQKRQVPRETNGEPSAGD